MTPATSFLLGAAGGAYAGHKYKKGLLPMVVGGALGSFALTSVAASQPVQAQGVYAGDLGPSPLAAQGIGWGALAVIGGIALLAMGGDKYLKKLGG